METRGPLVDVGMPVAGRVDYIAEAIESVLAQTLDRWRLTVSADGSENDRVRRVVERFLDDPRIDYVETGTRLGAAGNASSLIRSGGAPYVALLHDDDVWLPWFLEGQVAFLERHPECGFVFCANTVIDGSGREMGRSRFVLPEGVHQPAEFLVRELEHNLAATPTIVVRRSAYETVGAAFDERFEATWDYEMWLRLAMRFPTAYRASCDAKYRVHGDQLTFASRTRRAEEALLLLDHVEQLLARSPFRGRIPRGDQRRLRAAWTLSLGLSRLEAQDAPGARNALRRAVTLSPWAIVDPRAPVLALGIVTGRRATPWLRWLRTFVLRHGLRGRRVVRRTRVGEALGRLRLSILRR